MDRFEAMRAFARVVETGSFTRAAHTLQISRTTVTQLVQQLEAHLRLRLLNRTTRRVSVTADGAAYPRIVRLLAELEEVEGGWATQPASRAAACGWMCPDPTRDCWCRRCRTSRRATRTSSWTSASATARSMSSPTTSTVVIRGTPTDPWHWRAALPSRFPAGAGRWRFPAVDADARDVPAEPAHEPAVAGVH